MNIKQTVKVIVVSAILIALGLVFTPQQNAAALDSCGGVTTTIIHCDQTGGDAPQDSGAWGVLLLAINVLTAGVAITAVGGIIYGAILYTSAGGSPEQVKKAIGIITNVVIGIVAYALMYSGLNFLIPGGIFN